MQRVRKQIGVPEKCDWKTEKRVTVAVLDSGIGRHPDLSDRLLCFMDFVNHRKLMYDDNGHGTHVCGIICGSGALSRGSYCGIAPNALLVVGKVLNSLGDGNAEDLLAALEWIGRIHEKYRIRILNISVGIGNMANPQKEQALQQKLEELWDRGIVVICAAGNKGPANGSISSVGGNSRVITVGCHDGEYCKDNPKRCETYSGRGAWLDPIRKPDIVAPGTDIYSCNAAYKRWNGKQSQPYIAKCGTSMATPIVAGAAALALEKYPHMTNEELKQKLTYTATDFQEPWNKQGWGMIHVGRLLS